MSGKEIRFRAMGTHCHVLVDAPDAAVDELLELSRLRVELLEQSWSRFRPDSELSRLNGRSRHGPVSVSADLLTLVDHMRAAWRATDGLFDPTVLTAVRAAGYDADFSTIDDRPAASWQDIALVAVPGMAGVVVDLDASTVRLPPGVGLDPGAIGKGLAADLIATELRAAGATGALVNLGGDLSVAGTTHEPWAIDVEDERRAAGDPSRILQTIRLADGADRFGIATSTTLKRRWAQGRRHHVIDPRTGRPSVGGPAQVTVIAATAAQAEALATAALLMPAERSSAWLAERGADGIVLTHDSARLDLLEARRG